MNPKAEVLLAAIALRPRARIFVEIGCTRKAAETADDGFSTIYLAQEAKARHGVLHSVELNPHNIRVARTAVTARDLSNSVRFHEGRGTNWLKEFACPIDFLYLDGSDNAETNLDEFETAETKLSPDAIVCVDDCHAYSRRWFGKGDKVIPYAPELGQQLETLLSSHFD